MAAGALLLVLSLVPRETAVASSLFAQPAPSPRVPLDGEYGSETFPCPDELRLRVEFWIRIFAEFERHHKVLHDTRYPWIIYEVIDVESVDRGVASRRIDERIEYYRRLLDRMSRKEPSTFTAPEQRVARLLAEIPEDALYTRAKDRLRTQSGVGSAMLQSLQRSGRYLDRIVETLAYYGVPPEVAFLPHVESSFQPNIRSHAGAVGMWQFTAGTGQRFLQIEHDLDERLNPYSATVAAARFLRENAEKLGSWPLAVVSYNHGLAGVMRAMNRLGTDDVVRVLHEYDGPRFGFASQNFYCEFLAVIEIGSDPERFFGSIEYDPPLHVIDFPLDHYVKLSTLSHIFRVAKQELLELNPAIGTSYASGSRHLPKGYVLHLPGRVPEPARLYAGIPEHELHPEAPRPQGYQVRSGDTLSTIARSYRIPLRELRALNGLDRSDHIVPGQVLVLP